MDIHEIDAHLEQHEEAMKTVAAADVNLCHIYEGARPVILFVKALLFWRPKWQKVITDLVNSLDTQCGL